MIPRLCLAAIAALSIACVVVFGWTLWSPARATAVVEVAIDCDRTAPGTQSSCRYDRGTPNVEVGVIVVNNTNEPIQIGAFEFVVVTNQQRVLDPLIRPCDDLSAARDCNPDYNDEIPGSFVCNPPLPVADLNSNPDIAESRLVCHTSGPDGPTLAPGSRLEIASVRYVSSDGSAALAIHGLTIYDENFGEIGSCAPVNQVSTACSGAQVFVADPTNTPTTTNSPTPTNTPAPTPTALPGGSQMGMYVDCDVVTAGIQSMCVFPSGQTTVDVDIVLANHGQDADLSAFEVGVVSQQQGVLMPRAVSCATAYPANGRECNPDFSEAIAPSQTWGCGPPWPSPDIDPDASRAVSRLTCSNWENPVTLFPSNTTMVIATVKYTASDGAGDLELVPESAVFDSSSALVHLCEPTANVGYCSGARVQIGPSPYSPTPTLTGTPTPTWTPCAQGQPDCATYTPTLTPTRTPTVTLTPTVTNTPEPTPTGLPGGAEIGLYVDCDVARAGIQSTCVFPSDQTTLDVDIVLANHGQETALGWLDIWIEASPEGILRPQRPGCVTSYPFNGLECNPDFQLADEPDWACGPPAPNPDEEPDPALARSKLGCWNWNGYASVVARNSNRVIATVKYDTSQGLGRIDLAPGSVIGLLETVACDPAMAVALYCSGASVQIGPSPYSPTPTVTNTPTSTWTPCVQGEPGCATYSPTLTPTRTPTVTLTPTVTNTPEPTPTGLPGGVQIGMYVDCDVASAGIQSVCVLPSGLRTVDVDIVIANHGQDVRVATFDFRLETSQTDLQPVATNCVMPGFDCNPDFNQASLGNPQDWNCGPPLPNRDQDPSQEVARSVISCYNASGTGPLVRTHGSLGIARVRYVHAQAEAAFVSFGGSAVFDDSFSAVMSCSEPPLPDEPCLGATIEFDNCPGVDNPGQENLNSEVIPLPKPLPAWDDASNPASDLDGDACDPDIDGDGLANDDEIARGTDALLWDTDGDRVADGAEITCGSDPLQSSSVLAGADVDFDRLPDQCEPLVGADPVRRDTDGDGVNDGVEVRYWLTDPQAIDTDDDSCSDGREIATVNGDRIMNSGDLGIMASNYGALSSAFRPYDMNGDGVMNSGDLGFAASKYGPCSPLP